MYVRAYVRAARVRSCVLKVISTTESLKVSGSRSHDGSQHCDHQNVLVLNMRVKYETYTFNGINQNIVKVQFSS